MMRIVMALIAALTLAGGAANAAVYDLVIDEATVHVGGRARTAVAINGSVPGPLLRWREGEDVTVRVTNRLAEETSVHWHGLLVPPEMDGVPGLGFDAIQPGDTFVYRFTTRQSGTYWYHSHSGMQEQAGHYAPLIIDPARPEPVASDREYVLFLSDWTDEHPNRVLARLKKQGDYYNVQTRTVFDFFRDLRAAAGADARRAVVKDRLAWGRMRMDPTDVADVTGSTYRFLVNGKTPDENWTGLIRPGERVRLRVINGAAMTYFDVKIPGLKLTIVQADGQNVEPVEFDQFRIAVAETYDVIVEPTDAGPYTIFAAAMDRSGYARATLAPRAGMTAPIPPLAGRPILTMAAMGGMDEMGDMGTMGDMDGMADHAMHGPMTEGAGDAAPWADLMRYPEGDPYARGRTLRYEDLRALEPGTDGPDPGREIVIRLRGNMQRYFWSMDVEGVPRGGPIALRYGERVRLTFVNETMMSHPMHLHGTWMMLENGRERRLFPRKHTVNILPGRTYAVEVVADAPGEWAFHCHLLYHLGTGMMGTMVIAQSPAPAVRP